MRVSLLQTAPRLGAVDANLAELSARLGKVATADLAVAPELATHGYHLGAVDDVEPLPPTDDRIAALGAHGPAVIAGFVEAWRSHQCNSAAVVDRDRVRVQRKLYLPNYRAWEEYKHFRPGGRLHRFDVRGTELAVLICNDLWQPVVPWLAAHGGAEVLVVIANSSDTMVSVPSQRAWDILVSHAAIALQSYVIFVNRCGVECGVRFWGGSRAVGPDGESMVRLGEDPDVASVELDLTALRRHRRQMPLLKESRFDLVAREATRLAAEDE
jgi:predicted amidohydrolase